MAQLFFLVAFFSYFLTAHILCVKYKPNWKSLDRRPLPLWYDEAKFGIFMHWGVYSVPSFGRYTTWFWWHWKGDHDVGEIDFMKQNYRPGFTYADFGPQFTAEFFDSDRFAEIIKGSGAKYCILFGIVLRLGFPA